MNSIPPRQPSAMKWFLAFVLSLLPSAASAVELDLPTVFSDHMVLRRELNVPIWGKAESGSAIDVSFAGQTIKTQADETGTWRLQLAPMEASAESRVLTIQATLGEQKNQHQIQAVLAGEVRLAGGQSNIVRPFRMLTDDANQKPHQPTVKYLRDERDTANDPLLRQFRSGKVFCVDEPQFKGRGEWSKAVPGDVNEFSDTAYFLARELRRQLNVPDALLSCNLGGTLIEAWMPQEAFATTTELKDYYASKQDEFKKSTESWNADRSNAEHKQAFGAWKQKKSADQKVGREPPKPKSPDASKHNPCTLCNGIIHPVASYGLFGHAHVKNSNQLQSTPAKNKQHLFIMTGQSNMDRLNLDLSFIPTVEAKFGKANVTVIKDAQRGRPIRQWYKAWKTADGQPALPDATPKQQAKDTKLIGTLYDRLMKKVKPAVQEKTFDTITFCWMQGEKDAKYGHGSVYAKSLQGLIKQLSDDLGRDDINFVIGRLSDFAVDDPKIPDWNVVRSAQVKVANASPRGAWLNTDDLNDGLDQLGKPIKNDLHCSAEGYRLLGKRFAEKAIELIKAN